MKNTDKNGVILTMRVLSNYINNDFKRFYEKAGV